MSPTTEPNIELLLGRKEINLDTQLVQNQILHKRILVTGAAGSIGKAIVKQIIAFEPSALYLVDQSENGIHELELEFGAHAQVHFLLADITNETEILPHFKNLRPQIIFHAAAYKHVPIMEKWPYQAVKTNIFGTQILANLSVHFKAEKFIFVSTDKAVDPVNVMGMTKRLAEIYVQSLNNISITEFVIARFGNVLGSSGSVYLTFSEQIQKNEPLTVVGPNVSRYFMTPFEAAQLLIFAAAKGKGGEIFISKMGNPVLIHNLAVRMIRLSGKNLPISFIGLRDGDKPSESLLHDDEIEKERIYENIIVASFPTVCRYTIAQIIDSIKAIEAPNDQSQLHALLKDSIETIASVKI